MAEKQDQEYQKDIPNRKLTALKKIGVIVKIVGEIPQTARVYNDGIEKTLILKSTMTIKG